jgi:CheY-like chemotaxis protein
MAVTDTGTGMLPEVLERATEPFFSTKPAAAGSGLGLSMIYGFARQSGGHLWIDSAVGAGTTVRLYLPRAPAGAPGTRVGHAAAAAEPRGDEAILLVDDNLILREVTRRHLSAMGYHVGLAESGPEALALLQTGARFDLLFTDIVMPQGMTGYELAEAAARVQPDMKVLFTTGYDGDISGSDDDDHAAQPTLRKPYRRQELAERVRAVLDASEGGLAG